MISPRLRRAVVVASSLLLAAGTLVVAPDAVAAPAFHALSGVIVGDLTADGTADRLTLGTVARGARSVCAFQLRAGLGHGKFAVPYIGTLPLVGVDPGSSLVCPDAGVVVKGPDRTRNELAVTGTVAAIGEPSVQFFRGFATHAVRYDGGFDGQFQPSLIASTDFDGDGWGDIWETTDQGEGFSAWVGRPGTGWHQLYTTPFTDAAVPQFFDLNRAGGTDILVTWSDFGGMGSGAAAVDGRTGAVQTLGRSGNDPNVYTTSFQLAVIDLDHNLYPDLQLTTTDQLLDGTERVTTTDFRNRSQGGRWYFQPVTNPPARSRP